MLDAYTVGITLALNNGVSEGLAAVRRDLGELDQAIDTSAAALLHLRELARVMDVSAGAFKLTEISNGQPNSPDVVARRTPNNAVLQETSPLETSLSRITRFTVDDEKRAAGQDTGTPTTKETPAAAPVWRSTPLQAPGSLPFEPKSPPPPTATVDAIQQSAPSAPTISVAEVSHRTIQLDLSSPVTPSPYIPRHATAPNALGAPASVSVAPAHPVPVPGEDGERWAVSSGTDLASPIAAPAAPLLEAPVRTSRPVPGSEQTVQSDLFTRGAAPQNGRPAPVFAAPTGTLLSSYAAAISPGLPAAAPQGPEARPGPLQGDVYLDGTRLGRWIVDHLAKEADRPPAGTTNFDPRMNVTWPGAPIGN